VLSVASTFTMRESMSLSFSSVLMRSLASASRPLIASSSFRSLPTTEIAARHGATVPQIALAWLLAVSPATVLIPGTGSLAHLEENLAAGSITLTPRDSL
jgi:aryl-alcohol dehydrogenase-like predicted oxidoreductase